MKELLEREVDELARKAKSTYTSSHGAPGHQERMWYGLRHTIAVAALGIIEAIEGSTDDEV